MDSVQSFFLPFTMAILSSSSHSKVAAIISRPARSEVARTVPELLAWLHAHGYEVIVDPETAKYSNGEEEVSRSQMSSRSLDLVVVLGGDGTLLSAARATAAIDVPLLGVNLGSLGFLTDVPLSSLFSMLEAITKGEAAVEQRSLMQCDLLRGEEVLGSYLVFNDAVVNIVNTASAAAMKAMEPESDPERVAGTTNEQVYIPEATDAAAVPAPLTAAPAKKKRAVPKKSVAKAATPKKSAKKSAKRKTAKKTATKASKKAAKKFGAKKTKSSAGRKAAAKKKAKR